jgi:hypothetical protein
MVLPGKVALKGGAVFAPSQTRPEGAPLNAILPGERMPGTEDGLGPLCRRGHRCCVTAGTADLRKAGQLDLAAVARP